VAYPLTVIPQEFRLYYALNPLVGMICGFRWALLNQSCDWGCVAVSSAITLLLLGLGLLYFRRVERRFADVV